jgi:hypothetical protein
MRRYGMKRTKKTRRRRTTKMRASLSSQPFLDFLSQHLFRSPSSSVGAVGAVLLVLPSSMPSHPGNSKQQTRREDE